MKTFILKNKKWILICCLTVSIYYRHQSYNVETLRKAYVTTLMSYLSTPYVWGGESSQGIDCSGLIRSAYRAATKQVGWNYLQVGLFQEAYWLKHFDFRARDLGELPNFFVPLQTITSINDFDSSQLKAGDLAVIEDGSHVMAYLGHQDWIEANKSEGRVIIVHTPELELKHYQKPVTLYRWRQLQGSS